MTDRIQPAGAGCCTAAVRKVDASCRGVFGGQLSCGTCLLMTSTVLPTSSLMPVIWILRRGTTDTDTFTDKLLLEHFLLVSLVWSVQLSMKTMEHGARLNNHSYLGQWNRTRSDEHTDIYMTADVIRHGANHRVSCPSLTQIHLHVHELPLHFMQLFSQMRTCRGQQLFHSLWKKDNSLTDLDAQSQRHWIF
jgi:hypothetical protein